jgi:pentatricopeptide repeat protein
MMFKLLNSASCEPGRVGTELRHWNRAVRAFCRAKHMFDAKAVVRAMKGLGLEPDAETYVSLLDGYVLVGGNTNEVLMLWAEIRAKTTDNDHDDGSLRLDLALLDGFLSFFIRYGYFNNALDAIAKMEARQLRPDKEKYRNMYWHLHRDLYTSKHRSLRRVDLSQERRQQVDAFKRWVGISLVVQAHG